MPTCTVQLPLVPLEVGDVIDRSAWPPHVTLVGNASVADGATDTAAAVLRGFTAAFRAMHGRIGREARFGPDSSILVDLVDSIDLSAAHTALLDALKREVEGWALERPEHARSGYRAHRAVTSDPRPAPGSTLRFTEAALVEIEPAGMPGRAVVLARWPLGGSAQGAETTAADLHVVLDALAPRGVRPAVIGGWGVDALAGRRTRPHHDVDVLIDADELATVAEGLAAAGYRIAFAWSENRWQGTGARLLPSAFVAVDAVGREVDVHAVRFEGSRPIPVSQSTVALPPGALDAEGTIDGRSVRCATAVAQLLMHEGYPLPERQEPDVALLHELVARRHGRPPR